MEELELEVVIQGIEGLCVAIIAKSTILEKIKLKEMEDPKLKNIHDNLAMEPIRSLKW